MEFPISVIVKAGSKRENIKFDKDRDLYIISVKGAAEKGKANLDVIKLMNKYLGRSVRIIKGLKSRRKIIDIL